MPSRDSGRRMPSDLMSSRSRIEEPTPPQETSTIHYLRNMYVLFFPIRTDMFSAPHLHVLRLGYPLETNYDLVGDEGARFAAHDSNDGTCSSQTPFSCLAPSFTRDRRPSVRVDDSTESALVDTRW